MAKTPPKDDGFLSRWSRRKLAPDDEIQTDDLAAIGHNSAAAEPTDDAEHAELTDEELLEKLELPDPDTLVKGDDFKRFMETGIPSRLRNRALRRLWVSDPVLANVDMLVDYGEDFTDAATVIENMQTVYEVGKGAARRVREELDAALAAEEAEKERLAALGPQPDDEDIRNEVGESAESFETSEIEQAPQIPVDVVHSEPCDISAQRALEPAKSPHMRFTFE